MLNSRPSWQNPKILIVLLLVFLCGATAGALTVKMGYLRSKKVERAYRDISLDRMKKELSLTSDQTDKLEVVLDDFQHYYQDLQDQLAGVRASGKANILRVLNDGQKQKFEKMLAESSSAKSRP